MCRTCNHVQLLATPRPRRWPKSSRRSKPGSEWHARMGRRSRSLIRAPTPAAGVESVQAIRSCLVPTLTDIAGLEAMSQTVKGFGWRPVVSYPPVLRAGVRKPLRKEPAGAGRTASGLWGFDGAVAWVGDALAGVIGGGLTIAVVSLAPRWPLTGRFWPERRHRACGWRRWGDSDATPEAGFPGRRKVQ